jgi:Zn-dependent M28 family amino/carboxypeptidase
MKSGLSKLFVPLFLIVFFSCSNSKQLVSDKARQVSDKKEMGIANLDDISAVQKLVDTKEILTVLASDEYGGRKPGTEGYMKASNYVSGLMAANDILPFRNGSYQDTFMAKGEETYNIVGLIEGTGDDYVMICAHLDHLGPAKGADKIYNGANDNASGVTATLQVAKFLAQHKFEQNIIVALFSSEEVGLLGSKHLAQRLRKENVNLTHVFNFEMIGKTLTTGSNQVYITGFKRSNLAEEMNEAVGFEFVKFLPAAIRYQLFSRSDNFPFFAEFKIPSHTISTFDFENYEHYHKATDEAELLDIENMHDVIKTSTLALSKILMDNQVMLNEEGDEK